MIFEFTEQQTMIRKMAREFAEKEIAPSVMERDEKEEFSRACRTSTSFKQFFESCNIGALFKTKRS